MFYLKIQVVKHGQGLTITHSDHRHSSMGRQLTKTLLNLAVAMDQDDHLTIPTDFKLVLKWETKVFKKTLATIPSI